MTKLIDLYPEDMPGQTLDQKVAQKRSKVEGVPFDPLRIPAYSTDLTIARDLVANLDCKTRDDGPRIFEDCPWEAVIDYHDQEPSYGNCDEGYTEAHAIALVYLHAEAKAFRKVGRS